MTGNALVDLLSFYKRDLQESSAARTALQQLEITSPEVAEHFELGWCGGSAQQTANTQQLADYKKLGLVFRGKEKFINCLVLPVYDMAGQLVDLYGIRQYETKGNDRKYFTWQKQHRGLIGCACLMVYKEIILCDSVFLGLHVRQHGFCNVVALRTPDEIKLHVALLEKSGIRKIYLCSRQHHKKIQPHLEKMGIEVILIPVPANELYPPKESFNIVEQQPERNESQIELVSKTETRLNYNIEGTDYKIDSSALSGLGMRCQIKVERGDKRIIDKIDLASAASRTKFCRMAASKLSVPSNKLEDQLNEIADAVDNMMLEEAQPNTRVPKELSDKEKLDAHKMLQREDLLQVMADALESCCGIVGEEANRKLCVLITASRLLPKPLGCIIRGNPGSGKSSLISAASKLLPPTDVLYLSRLTPQALYFLPREQLQNKLLVVDEYAGLSNSEYSLRSMMSSQMLSLAITVREGGKLPSTKMIEIPVTLAVMVSSTQEINIENLSRFIELKMDTSPEQTRKVIQNMASPSIGKPQLLESIRNANQLLKPCQVEVPFADKLVFTGSSVQARRQFEQLIGLIKAHSGLSQARREHQTVLDDTTTIIATEDDYKAVHGLLRSIVTHNEESLSPFAQNLLDTLVTCDKQDVTIKDIMNQMSCSYSKAYRSLNELKQMGLVIPDRYTNGIERSYQIAPYIGISNGFKDLPVWGYLYMCIYTFSSFSASFHDLFRGHPVW